MPLPCADESLGGRSQATTRSAGNCALRQLKSGSFRISERSVNPLRSLLVSKAR